MPEPTTDPRSTSWTIRGGALPLGHRTLLMGILNVTPDSFSDGGRFLELDQAVRHATAMEADGADLLDIGGESTRPGSQSVPEAEELRRILPVLDALKGRVTVPISVDTRHARVAHTAIEHGAKIINDVSALADPEMAATVKRSGAGMVLMHMRGEPKSMQASPHYDDVVREVSAELLERAQRAERAGIPRGRIVLDPGLGFGKRTGQGIEDNATLLKRLPEIRRLGYPILIGASRKTFIGNLTHAPIAERLEGSLAAAAVAAWNGADIIRAHDVRATRRVLDLIDAVRTQP